MRKAYQVEIGCLLDKDDEDYDAYNTAYNRDYSYYDQGLMCLLSYEDALDFVKHFVKTYGNNSYGIVSTLYLDDDIFEEDNICDGRIDDLDLDCFDFSKEGITYSAFKKNGKIIENAF